MTLGFTSAKPFKAKLVTYRKKRKREVDFRLKKQESDREFQRDGATHGIPWTPLSTDTPLEHPEWFEGGYFWTASVTNL